MNKKQMTYRLGTLILSIFAILTTPQKSYAEAQLECPPKGWNSFCSYGVYLHHDAAMANAKAMVEKFKQYGYEYYVIDAGWFGEFELQEGTIYPMEVHAKNLNINKYGLLQPSKCYFPNGFKEIVDYCHSNGLKFGVHIMRGIPRIAYERNTIVKGTKYRARDITDTSSICNWCPQNYGVDMSKPGAQEFYDSLIAQLASWGVDFIKADDIVPFPKEVEAVAKAIEKCGREIVLSLSPGGTVKESAISSFKMANMLRVTHDIWDDQVGIEQCFAAWRRWSGYASPNFYIDMDMIPFGELQIMAPMPAELTGDENKYELRQRKAKGELSNIALMSGKGWYRWCEMSEPMMRTFITLRSLSASPLLIGGDLNSMDDYAYYLLTNSDMLECNTNGVMGTLLWEVDGVECWSVTSKSDESQRWVGVFNRNKDRSSKITISSTLLGLDASTQPSKCYDVWGEKSCNIGDAIEITPNDVIFLSITTK